MSIREFLTTHGLEQLKTPEGIFLIEAPETEYEKVKIDTSPKFSTSDGNLNNPLTTKMDTRDGWVDFNRDSDSSDSEETQIPGILPTDRHFSPAEKNFLEGKVKTAAEIKTVFQDTLKDTGLDPQTHSTIEALMNIAFPGRESDNLAQMISKLAHITLKKVQEPNGKTAEEQGQEIIKELFAIQTQE